MLETQISPIFGLNLVELVEWLAIVSIMGVFITAFFLYQQNTSKNKLDSIYLTKEILTIIKKNEILLHVHRKVYKNNCKNVSNYNIILLLNEFEDLAMYWKERMVYLRHIKEIHGSFLRTLKKNQHINNIIKTKNDEDKTNLTNLMKLLKKL